MKPSTEKPITTKDLSFTMLKGNTLVTKSVNMTVTGHPTLLKDHNTTFILLNGTKQWLEIPRETLPCLTGSNECHSGFTFQVGVLAQVVKPGQRVDIISNGKDSSSAMSLYYESNHLHLSMIRGDKKWTVAVPYGINLNKLDTYQVSWSKTEGLELYVNNVLLGKQQTSSTIPVMHTMTNPIHVGHTDSTLLVTNIQMWSGTRSVLSERGILGSMFSFTTVLLSTQD